MKEELLKNLVGIIEYVKQGADFVKKQAPLFVQEFITFKTYLYLFYDIVSIIGFIAGTIMSFKFFKKAQESYDDVYGMLCVITGFLVIVSTFASLYFTKMLLEVYFAPRVFVVEKLLEVLK